MKTIFLVAALFIASAVSQPVPTARCTRTPVAQWMGELHESNHESFGGREPVIRTAYIFYDATNKRINITERELFEPGDRTNRITEIYLHDKTPPMRYRVDLVTGECTTEELTEPFRPFGVPGNATFLGIDYLGAEIATLGLLVDSFYENSESGGHYHGFWAPVGTASEASCAPIIETYRNRNGPIPRRDNIHATFRNIVPITATKPFPASTFTIPAACLQRA